MSDGIGARRGAGRSPVEVQITGGDPVTEFSALWEWLRRERALVGTVRPIQKPPSETELGGAFDVLAVALGSGGAGVILASSLTTWIQNRHSDVTITVTTSTGTVELSAQRIKDGRSLELLQEVLRASDDR